MRKLCGIIAALCCSLYCAGAYAAETATMKANPAPSVLNVEMNTNTYALEAVKYPDITISNYYDTTEGCATFLGQVSNTNIRNNPLGFEQFRLYEPYRSKPSLAYYYTNEMSKVRGGKLDLEDMYQEVHIDYPLTSKVLVTWTIRVEGECETYLIGHNFCDIFKGDIDVSCRKDNVKSYLFVNGAQMGPAYTIEMPPTRNKTHQVDPTLTGSYLIKPENFSKNASGEYEMPAVLKLQIKWENFTSMRITCPSGMRSMIVHVMPITRNDQE